MTSSANSLTLLARRAISAPPDAVFDAWTRPEQLMAWWGPGEVTCPVAEIDLRVGGRYRLCNLLPSGERLWITGEFEQVEPPVRLVYTWVHEPVGIDSERSRVTVRFQPHPKGTEVIVVHERLATLESRDLHLQGWQGCLLGLEALFSA